MSDPAKELAEKLNAFLKKRYGSDSPAMQKRLFDDYDTDRDGRIAKAELKHLLEDAKVGNTFTRGMWVDGVMETMDTSENDGISWEEYETAINDAMRRR